ncbi:type II toxin-antitoxin system VapC family toxin [Candidatus Oscillochloris fontis]|uniref:type II toxin-antitoxin system VapC family toxin n=1 Tax=Candidatus Oscillochloris fontis TaxID=2496868 RepID=UPI00101CD3A0|nr:type II toxin-antitoxin system VapC family toxin [Candidatus Oscillochloris fontis]
MTTVLLDTNIVSFVLKHDTRANLYAPHLLNQEHALAIMTIAELFQWAALRHWGEARITQLEQHLNRYTLLPVDIEVCRYWGKVRAARSAAGLPLSPQDAWIAATALRYNLPLITHNPDDFQQISGLLVITEER